MKDLSKLFSDIYLPEKALLILKSQSENHYYIESYDLDDHGAPINAHPLSVAESNALAKALDSSTELHQGFLSCRGIIPENVLHVNTKSDGHAVWHTPMAKANLFFKGGLTIPDGRAFVPPLLWKASRSRLQVWALAKDSRPGEDSLVYHAPFFNIGQGGSVCMGNVSIDIDKNTYLEDFMDKWQDYFFNSRFSHMIEETSPVRRNIVQLWQDLIGTDYPFPIDALISTKRTLKQLIQ